MEKYWSDTNLNEMKAYFGLATMLGVLGQHRYKNYWSSNPFLGNKSVQNVMTLRRYQKLSEYLHVSDREQEKPHGHPEYDELAKPQWLLNHVLEMFPKYKHPECHQTIDEGMVKFSGRCRFLQWNPMKPVRRGVKLYIRTCATNAYCQTLQSLPW